MLETWMNNGWIEGVRQREEMKIITQIFRYKKKSFLTLALPRVSKKNNPISVKQGFYSSCT